MNQKVYANKMIETMGLKESIRVISGINTKVLRDAQDLFGVDKKKRNIQLTNNKKTAAYFESVLGYLRSKENGKK